VTRLTVGSASVESNPGKRQKPWAALRSQAGTLTCYRESRGVSAQKGSLSIEKVHHGSDVRCRRSDVCCVDFRSRCSRAQARTVVKLIVRTVQFGPAESIFRGLCCICRGDDQSQRRALLWRLGKKPG
jgi:hypothetical protein